MSALFRADGQWAVFLLFCTAGALAGIWRDCIYGMCALMETGKAAKIAAGVLAGAGAAFLAAAACFFATGGEPRVYMLIGLIAGAALYRATFGTLFRYIARTVSLFARKIAAWLQRSKFCQRIFR